MRIVKSKSRNLLRELSRISTGQVLFSNPLDPKLLNLAFQLGQLTVEVGARRFGDFVGHMVSDFGDPIRPHLVSLYEGIRKAPGSQKFRSQMTTAEEVQRLSQDLDAILRGDSGPEFADQIFAEAKARIERSAPSSRRDLANPPLVRPANWANTLLVLLAGGHQKGETTMYQITKSEAKPGLWELRETAGGRLMVGPASLEHVQERANALRELAKNLLLERAERQRKSRQVSRLRKQVTRERLRKLKQSSSRRERSERRRKAKQSRRAVRTWLAVMFAVGVGLAGLGWGTMKYAEAQNAAMGASAMRELFAGASRWVEPGELAGKYLSATRELHIIGGVLFAAGSAIAAFPLFAAWRMPPVSDGDTK